MEDDGDDKDDSKRKSRNLSEKKRRDQFNMLVNELSSMISTNTRKMDKSTVLKSTISFLKNHQEITVRSRVNEIQENWKPSFLSNEEFTHLILEALDGFIIVFSSCGMILYASESITSLLGHLPNEILNTSLYNLTYEDDRTLLYSILQNAEDKWDDLQDENFKDNQVTFSCHLKRNCIEGDDDQSFDLVEFIGYFKRYSVPQSPMENANVPYRVNNTDVRIIFVCTGRLRIPQLIREMPVLDFSNSEFTSRHSLEWKFLFLDHRAPPIIGYLPFEVLGTSGYDYYHFDDLENVISCHEALMQKGEGTSCYYRFLTKGQQWIWLQTRFYITYHQWNSKPEFVVCTHRVVSCVDVFKNAKNECTPLTQIDDFNSEKERKTLIFSQDTSSLLPKNVSFSHNSNWNRTSNRFNLNTNDLTNVKRKYRQSSVLSPEQTSDTGSMSAESIISKQSTNTHGSLQSHDTYNRKDHTNQLLMNTYPQNQYQIDNIHTPNQYPPQQNLLLHAPVHNSQYLDPSQYVAVPVQPVIGFSQIQGVPASPDMSILITPAQAQIQQQLQKKHEELQQMIIQQQEELRRVSEQLVMARYGLLPPIINVPVPYSSQGSPGTSSTATHVYTSGMPGMMQRPVIEPVLPNDNEYIPMQMSQQQAQLLFSSPNHNQNYTRDM